MFTATLAVALPAVAQEDVGSAVTINLDVLYSLDEGPLPGHVIENRAPLLPAPSQAPRSRLLVKPAPGAKPEPELAAISEPAAPAAAEPAVAEPVLADLPEPISEPFPSQAPLPAPPAEPDLSAQPAPKPAPAPEPEATPPEPTESSVAQAPAVSPTAPQSAALPPAPAPDLDSPIRLLFEPESATLSDTASQSLDDLAIQLIGAQGQRIQLLAYADQGGSGNSVARRLSLSRALSVRGYLASKGVPTAQIDVRALGSKYEDGPPDRVDIIYASN